MKRAKHERACPILTFETDMLVGQRPQGAEITAINPKGKPIAWIEIRMNPDGGAIRATVIHVRRDMRRCGLGTQLYERAAKLACEMGYPLSSDYSRSANAQKFWEKQVAKGRAICAAEAPRPKPALPASSVRGRGGCLYYTLKNCDIADLRGRRRR
jgi:GNAT superfamily N-acetyltransferase